MLVKHVYFLMAIGLCVIAGDHTTLLAGKPSWKTYAIYIDGIKTAEEAAKVKASILKTDPKMVKTVKGLTATSGHALIHHDHHNITIQKIAKNIFKVGNYKVFTKLHIPDYQKVQGTVIGEKLNALLAMKGRGYRVKTIDKDKGLFEVILQRGTFKGRGFNFGDLAHPISDPIVFGGLGLNMTFIGVGENSAGALAKDAIEKEVRFRKKGKATKAYKPELLKAYMALFDYPTDKLKKYYP